MDMAQVVITVPRERKGAWVAASRAQGRKLTDWLIERIDAPELQKATGDFAGFALRVGALYPFERYVLAMSDDDARSILKRVQQMDAQQDAAVAAIKVARSYMEKRVAMADGIADRDLFRDITTEALGYYGACPGLTHLDLLAVLASA